MGTRRIGIINKTEDEDVTWGTFLIEAEDDRNFKVCDIIEGSNPGIITDFIQYITLAQQAIDGKFSIVKDGIELNAAESLTIVSKWYDDPYSFIPYIMTTYINSHNQVGSAQAHWNAGKLQGKLIALGEPSNGQVLSYNSTDNTWVPTTLSGGSGGIQTRIVNGFSAVECNTNGDIGVLPNTNSTLGLPILRVTDSTIIKPLTDNGTKSIYITNGANPGEHDGIRISPNSVSIAQDFSGNNESKIQLSPSSILIKIFQSDGSGGKKSGGKFILSGGVAVVLSPEEKSRVTMTDASAYIASGDSFISTQADGDITIGPKTGSSIRVADDVIIKPITDDGTKSLYLSTGINPSTGSALQLTPNNVTISSIYGSDYITVAGGEASIRILNVMRFSAETNRTQLLSPDSMTRVTLNNDLLSINSGASSISMSKAGDIRIQPNSGSNIRVADDVIIKPVTDDGTKSIYITNGVDGDNGSRLTLAPTQTLLSRNGSILTMQDAMVSFSINGMMRIFAHAGFSQLKSPDGSGNVTTSNTNAVLSCGSSNVDVKKDGKVYNTNTAADYSTGGETLTVNKGILENVLSSRAAARAAASTTLHDASSFSSGAEQVANSSTNIAIQWDIKNFEGVMAYQKAAEANSKIFIKETGTYILTGSINYWGTTSNYRFSSAITFNVNGVAVPNIVFTGSYVRATSGANMSSVTFSTVMKLNADEALEIMSRRQSTTSGNAKVRLGTNISIIRII